MKKFPHTYVIVFFIILATAILTWIIPGGEYARKTIIINGQERTIIDASSFKYTQNYPQLFQIFSAFYQGFVNQAGIIIFIIIIGGCFWIINKTQAIDAGIQLLLTKLKKANNNSLFKIIETESLVLISVMLIFSLFGAIFGMSEETIAFIVIFVPLAISMGYDSIVGVAITYLAAHVGFATAILNPFTIGIAQGISQLPLFSGLEYRFFCWIIINIIAIFFVLRYAKRIKANPQLSPMHKLDSHWRNTHNNVSIEPLPGKIKHWILFMAITILLIYISFKYSTTNIKIGSNYISFNCWALITIYFLITSILTLLKSVRYFILNLLITTIYILIIGVLGYSWYIKEIASLFFALGIISGIAYGFSANDIAREFINGAKDILSAALVVGLAGGIIVLLNDSKIIDTILYNVSSVLQNTHKISSISIMYLIHTGLNILIPSGSAKAALTMPIMSQFSDLINISRQLSVLAFQFGDGFTNMITPTSGVLLGALSMAKIPYTIWVRWIFYFILTLIIIGWILLIPPLYINFNGF